MAVFRGLFNGRDLRRRLPAWRRVKAVIITALVVAGLLFAGAASAADRERVDLYDNKGRRTGYALVDRESGRVDFYDRGSRRTGYCVVQPDGRVERFDLKGRRETPTVVPPPIRREPR